MPTNQKKIELIKLQCQVIAIREQMSRSDSEIKVLKEQLTKVKQEIRNRKKENSDD